MTRSGLQFRPRETDTLAGMAVTQNELSAYEGLIYTHALRVVGIVDGELDDILQVYRIKAWYAIERWDASGGLSQRRWVFGALKNAEKDLLKRRRYREVFLEDQPIGSCEPCEDHDAVFGLVDEGQPLIPNTLTDRERHIMVLLYRGYRQNEIVPLLGMAKNQMEPAMRSIRSKMEDWRPPRSARPPRPQPKVQTAVAA